MASEIPAAIKPYSIAVAPEQSVRKARMTFILKCCQKLLKRP
jgi:hypothetical protein